MTLVNPKPLGWAYGEILTSAQMNSFGTQLPKALDGIGGGTYALTAPLVLNDQNVTIELLLTAGTLSVGGIATIGGLLTANASISTNNLLTEDFSAENPFQVRFTQQVGPDGNATIDPDDGNIVIVPVLTGNKAYTLDGSSVDGDWILLKNNDGADTITVNGSFSQGPGTLGLFLYTAGWTRVFAWT